MDADLDLLLIAVYCTASVTTSWSAIFLLAFPARLGRRSSTVQ